MVVKDNHHSELNSMDSHRPPHDDSITAVSEKAAIIEERQLTHELERMIVELSTVAEVGTAISTILDTETLLNTVVELTRSRFQLYHAHIYLLDAAGENLVLTAGAGEPGRVMKARGHRIPLNREHSLVARCARTRLGVISNDVTREPDFLPNDVLPDTRSELAIPMIIGDTLIGVLDVQSDHLNHFDDNDVRVKTTLASQVAVAVQNARQYEAVQQQYLYQRATVQISELLRVDDELETVLENVFSVIKDSFRVDSVVLSNFNHETQTWHGVTGVGPGLTRSIVQTFVDPVERYPHGVEVLRTSKVVAVDRAWEYPNFPEDFLDETKMGIKSVMAVPIFKGDAVASVLWLNYTSRQHTFTEQQILLARSLSSQISNGMERKRAEQEVQLYADIVKNMQSGLYVYQLEDPNDDRTLRLITANATSTAFTGVAAEDIVGKTLDENFPGLREAGIPQIYAAVARGERLFETEDIYYGDARVVAAAFAVKAFPLPGMKVGVTFENISERKRAEQELNTNREQLQAILDNATAVIYVKDVNGKYLIVNQRYLDLFHLRSEDILGKTDHDIFPVEIADNFVSADRQVIQTNEVIQLEEVAPQDDGLHTFVSSKFPLRSADGQVYAMCGISTDITERIRSEQLIAANARRAEQLAQINAALSRTTNENEVLEAMALYAGQFGPHSINLSYLDVDADGNPTTNTTVASWRDGSIWLDDPFLNVPIPLAQFPITQLWSSDPSQVLFIENPATDIRVNEALKQIMAVIGINAFIAIPLYTGGKWEGIISLTWQAPRTYSDDERSIYQAVVQTASAVVASRRAFVNTQRAEAFAQELAAELQTVAEVSTAVTTILDLDELLQNTVDKTKTDFKLYHTHIYLLDEAGENLVLAAGAGEPGRLMKQRGHRIPLSREQSLVARAARTREAVISNDVTQQPDFLPNPMLPDTRSEMSIPMVIGETLIGVLDVQSERINRFDDNDVRVKTTLASQIAVAIKNARTYTEAERAHRETSNIYDLSIDMIGTAGFDGYFTSLNPAWEKTLGFTNDELLAKPFIEFVHTDDREATIRESAKLAQGAVTIAFENRYATRSGVYKWISWRAVPVVEDGVIYFIARDITEEKEQSIRREELLRQAEQQALLERQTAERLRQVDVMKSQFLANMSHELRTPLNSIIGYSEVLLDGDDGDLTQDAVEDVQTIHNSGHHLLAIINDILDLAKIEAGEMKMDRQPVELPSVIANVVHAAQVLVKEKPVALNFVQDGEVSLVLADALRLRQITTNLVSNAVKFTEQGSVTVSIGQWSDGEAYVRVQDTGIGIAQEDIGLIFDQFRQVDGSSTRRAGGTGLGLTITRHLVNLHGGSIHVESELGKGSTFWFTLPLVQPAPVA
jgi:PAS domain S-box-containing protein